MRTIKRIFWVSLFGLVVSSLPAHAGASRSVDADSLISSDHTKSYPLPSTADTLAGQSPSNGGTGQTTYTDGQLLIGNTTGNTLTKATLTAGTNVTITNGHGSITIAASSAPVFAQEAPTGSCNGSNTSFTLANTPSAAASVMLHLDGLILTQGAGNDYTISGSTITLATACASGQTLWAVYTH